MKSKRVIQKQINILSNEIVREVKEVYVAGGVYVWDKTVDFELGRRTIREALWEFIERIK